MPQTNYMLCSQRDEDGDCVEWHPATADTLRTALDQCEDQIDIALHNYDHDALMTWSRYRKTLRQAQDTLERGQ